jgi:hypothetical protein
MLGNRHHSRWLFSVVVAGLVILGAQLSHAQRVPVPDECITDVSATPVGQPRMVQCQGATFRFLITVPATCAREGGCGLITSVPGLAVSPQQDDENLGLAEAARNLPRPFITMTAQRSVSDPMVIALFGPGAMVNFIDISPMGSQTELVAFIQRAARVFAVDPKRIHLGGFSQGGQVTFNIICNPQLSQMFASFVAHAAAQPGTAPTQVPEQACFGAGRANPDFAPLLMVSGMTDGIVPPVNVQNTVMDIVTSKNLQERGVSESGLNGFMRRQFSSADGKLILDRIDYANENTQMIPGAGDLKLLGHCYVGPVTPNAFSCEGPDGFRLGETELQFYIEHPKP